MKTLLAFVFISILTFLSGIESLPKLFRYSNQGRKSFQSRAAFSGLSLPLPSDFAIDRLDKAGMCTKEKTALYRQVLANYYQGKLAKVGHRNFMTFLDSDPYLPDLAVCEASMFSQTCYKQSVAKSAADGRHQKINGLDFRERIIKMINAPQSRLQDECNSIWAIKKGNIFGETLDHEENPENIGYHQDQEIIFEFNGTKSEHKNNEKEDALKEAKDMIPYYLKVFLLIHAILVIVTLFFHLYPRDSPLLGRIWRQRQIETNRNLVTVVNQRDVAKGDRREESCCS